MNKLILISSLIFLFLNITFAQHKPIALSDENYDNFYRNKSKAIIKGKIINATAEELKGINIQYAMVNITEPSQTEFNINPSEDGTFTIEQNHNIPYQQVWLSLGKYAYTCLYMDEELEITFDLEKLKTKSIYILGDGMTFGGKDGDLNQTMNEFVLFNKNKKPNLHKEINSLNIEDKNYIQKLDSLFTIQRNLNLEFNNEIENPFQFIIDARTNAQYNYNLLSYYYQNSITIENISSLLTPIYSISNDTGHYLRFLRYYVNNMYYTKYPEIEYRNNYKMIFDFVDKTLPKNYSEIIKLNFDDRDLVTRNKIYKQALLSSKSDWAKEILTHEIAQLDTKEKEIKELLRASSVNKESDLGTLTKALPFDAKLYLDKSANGNSLLQEIKASFPNKLIILDIWATWCVPCLSQMPASKDLHKLAQDQNLPIEFVYLCTNSNSDETKWENKITEIQQPGTHLFVDNKIISELFTLFNRGGYPTYVAIKPNGEIDTKSISWISQLKIEDLKKMLE